MFTQFMKRWTVTTVAVLMAANVVPGISYDSLLSLALASLLLGLLNAFLRPLLILITFSLLVFTLGLFTLVINAALLMFTGSLLEGFHVRDFATAFWGGLVISITTFLLNWVTGWNRPQGQGLEGQKPGGWVPPEAVRRRRPGAKDDGPVIDV